MAKQPYEDKKCNLCGKPLLKETWGSFGDLIEIRVTCSDLKCKLEPYHSTELKEDDNALEAG